MAIAIIGRGNARRVFRGRRREAAPLADLVSVEIEDHRDGHQDGGDAAEKGGGPLHAETLEHVL